MTLHFHFLSFIFLLLLFLCLISRIFKKNLKWQVLESSFLSLHLEFWKPCGDACSMAAFKLRSPVISLHSYRNYLQKSYGTSLLIEVYLQNYLQSYRNYSFSQVKVGYPCLTRFTWQEQRYGVSLRNWRKSRSWGSIAGKRTYTVAPPGKTGAINGC